MMSLPSRTPPDSLLPSPTSQPPPLPLKPLADTDSIISALSAKSESANRVPEHSPLQPIIRGMCQHALSVWNSVFNNINALASPTAPLLQPFEPPFSTYSEPSPLFPLHLDMVKDQPHFPDPFVEHADADELLAESLFQLFPQGESGLPEGTWREVNAAKVVLRDLMSSAMSIYEAVEEARTASIALDSALLQHYLQDFNTKWAEFSNVMHMHFASHQHLPIMRLLASSSAIPFEVSPHAPTDFPTASSQASPDPHSESPPSKVKTVFTDDPSVFLKRTKAKNHSLNAASSSKFVYQERTLNNSKRSSRPHATPSSPPAASKFLLSTPLDTGISKSHKLGKRTSSELLRAAAANPVLQSIMDNISASASVVTPEWWLTPGRPIRAVTRKKRAYDNMILCFKVDKGHKNPDDEDADQGEGSE